MLYPSTCFRSVPCNLRFVCFDVKYLWKNIFSFYSIYFVVKHLVKSKIFSINQTNLKANLCKIFYTLNIGKIFYNVSLRLCLGVHKGMEWNGMYLSKGNEWKRME